MGQLEKIGGILVFAAFWCMLIVPDWIAGVTKAQRMGKVPYPKEQRRKKWKWVLIFFGIMCVGLALVGIAAWFSR